MGEDATILRFPSRAEPEPEPEPEPASFEEWAAVEVADLTESVAELDLAIEDPETFWATWNRIRHSLSEWEPRFQKWRGDG